jgi:hypothetical protein
MSRYPEPSTVTKVLTPVILFEINPGVLFIYPDNGSDVPSCLPLGVCLKCDDGTYDLKEYFWEDGILAGYYLLKSNIKDLAGASVAVVKRFQLGQEL